MTEDEQKAERLRQSIAVFTILAGLFGLMFCGSIAFLVHFWGKPGYLGFVRNSCSSLTMGCLMVACRWNAVILLQRRSIARYRVMRRRAKRLLD